MSEEYFRNIFNTYDSIDLLEKISALNLIFENQNKNVYFTYLTNYALFNQNTNRPKCSSKKFKEIVNEVQKISDLSLQIDPSESPFFEYVFYDKKYGIFNGINTSSAYYVNMIIQTLIYRENDLPDAFKNKALKFIKTGLTISDIIYKKLNISFDDIRVHKCIEKIIVPANLDKLSSFVCLNKKEISDFISDEEFLKYFAINIEDFNFENVNSSIFPFYYERPFVISDDKIIVIDPTSICYFLKKLCLNISNEFHCQDGFVKEYNNCVASYSFKLCKTISGVNFSSKAILESNSDIYKANAFECGKDKAVLYICLCSKNFSNYDSNYFGMHLYFDKLINETFKQLSNIGFSKNNIYTFIIMNSIIGSCIFNSAVNFKNKPIIISAAELEIIQTNEIDSPFFLQNFTNLLNFYYQSLSMNFNIINLISMINETDYDMYIRDDIRVKDTNLTITPDFAYQYFVKAQSKLQNNVSKFYGNDLPIRLIKCEESIYCINSLIHQNFNTMLMFLQLANTGIWISFNTNDADNILICRVILYWLGQIKKIINQYVNDDLYIQILKSNEYSVDYFSNNKCMLKYTKECINKHDNSNNENEISLVIDILKCFNLFNNDIAEELYKKSNLKNKKIIYKVNIDNDQISKPLCESLISIKSEKIIESIMDDKIGEYLVKELKIPFGKIDNPGDVLKNVVGFLYKEFETYIGKFEWLTSVKKCYLHTENFIQTLSLSQDNMKHEMALYPEQEEGIKENYNRTNSSSVVLRFVVEYIGTVRPNGNKPMNEFDIEYSMSIVTAIIKWARICDAIEYGFIEQIYLLKSFRIGFDHKVLNRFNDIVSDVVFYETSHKLNFKSNKKEEWPFKNDLDKAYINEHGFTIDDIAHVISLFLIIGDKQKNEIKQATINEFVILIESEKKSAISKDLFLKVVDYISIGKRDKFYDNIIKPRELHPWKYNRIYSLLRKPIIRCDDCYIWGNRMVENLHYHLVQTILRGKEPSSKDGKLSINALNGKILEFYGDKFNDYAYEYLKEKIPEVIFYKCVKSINSKKIENKQKQFLGDIDILGIDKNKKRIYLIETKNFSYSRDLSELDIEIKEMFINTQKKNCFLTKEINRVTWAQEHVSDIIKEYCLDAGDWKIRYTFLTNKPLISIEFTKKKVNATFLKHINLEYLRNLKDK